MYIFYALYDSLFLIIYYGIYSTYEKIVMFTDVSSFLSVCAISTNYRKTPTLIKYLNTINQCHTYIFYVDNVSNQVRIPFSTIKLHNLSYRGIIILELKLRYFTRIMFQNILYSTYLSQSISTVLQNTNPILRYYLPCVCNAIKEYTMTQLYFKYTRFVSRTLYPHNIVWSISNEFYRRGNGTFLRINVLSDLF